MSVSIVSGASSDLWTIDPTSKAGRVTDYTSAGVEIYQPHTLRTYSAACAAFSPPATPTDVFTITGNATTTLKVYRIGLSNVQTTAGVNSWFLLKRSTADSSGTPATVTAVPNDRNDTAANTAACVQNWTANPTLGSLVGNVWAGKVNCPAPGTAGIGGFQGVVIDFSLLFGRPIILRGTGDVLAWNFAGAALPTGLSVHCFVTWSEEP